MRCCFKDLKDDQHIKDFLMYRLDVFLSHLGLGEMPKASYHAMAPVCKVRKSLLDAFSTKYIKNLPWFAFISASRGLLICWPAEFQRAGAHAECPAACRCLAISIDQNQCIVIYINK